MKFNQNNLDKLETILDENKYVYRYERGNFQSGFCILENKKVVVLNKFLSVEGRINTMIELIAILPIDYDNLSPLSKKTFDDAKAMLVVA
jgi:hypothetical protein